MLKYVHSSFGLLILLYLMILVAARLAIQNMMQALHAA